MTGSNSINLRLCTTMSEPRPEPGESDPIQLRLPERNTPKWTQNPCKSSTSKPAGLGSPGLEGSIPSPLRGRFRASGQGAAKAGASEHRAATSSPRRPDARPWSFRRGRAGREGGASRADLCASSESSVRVDARWWSSGCWGRSRRRSTACPSRSGRPQQRALLALLLLSANEVVSRDRIVDELWGERPPATAAKLVQVYVSRAAQGARRPTCSSRARPATCSRSSPTRSTSRASSACRRGRRGAGRGRARRGGGALARGAGAVARAGPRRPRARRRSRRREADAARGAAAGGGRAIGSRPTSRSGATTSCRRARGAGRRAPAARAAARPAHARALPLGAPGRGARRLPGRAPRARRRARASSRAASCASSSRRSCARTRRSTRPRRRRPTAPPERLRRPRARARPCCVGALDERWRGSRAPGARRRRARDRQEPPGRGARAPRPGPRRAGLRRALLGGRRRARLLAVGAGAARLPARRRPRRAARRSSRAGGAELATLLPELRATSSRPAARRRRDAGRALPAARGGRDLPARRPAARRPLVARPRRPARRRRALAAAPALPRRPARRTRRCSSSAATATPRSAPSWPHTLADVAREAGTEQVALRGLERSRTPRALLAQTMGDAPRDDLAAEIHAETQGNPLFAEEIGRLLAAEGADRARPAADPARRARGDRPAPAAPVRRVPRGARTGLGRRPGVRPGRARAHERRSARTRCSPRSTRRPSAGLVGDVPEARGRLRFSHILVRDALYEDLPAAAPAAPAPRGRARRSRSCTPATPSRIWPSWPSTTRRGAGSWPRRRSCTPSGRATAPRASTAYEEAASCTHGALALLETARSGDDDRMRELLLALGEALSRAGRGGQAREVAAPGGRAGRAGAVVPTSSRARRYRVQRAVRVGAGEHRPASTCRCSSGRLPRWARMTAARASACWRGSPRRGATTPCTRSVSRCRRGGGDGATDRRPGDAGDGARGLPWIATDGPDDGL